jgi:hypothetical protein
MALGYVPSITERSGSKKPESIAAVAAADAERLPLVQYPQWFADGHQALHCECGAGTVTSRIKRSGRAVVLRAEGSCTTCGGAVVTAGQWRRARHPNCYRHVASGERGDPNVTKITFALGNPLTYNHWYTAEMADRRFGTGEGGISHIANKYGFTKRRRVRTRDQVRVEMSIAFAMQHAVALQRQGVIQLTPAAGPTLVATAKARVRAGDERAAARRLGGATAAPSCRAAPRITPLTTFGSRRAPANPALHVPVQPGEEAPLGAGVGAATARQ